MSNLSTWVTFWTTFYVLSSIVVTARLFLRYQHRRITKSDHLAAFCLVLSTVLYACAMVVGALSYTTFTIEKDHRILPLSVAYMVMAGLIIPFSKLCVVFLLYEVEVADAWKLRLKVIGGLILATCCFYVFCTLFGCYGTPIGTYWTVIKGDVPINPNSLKQRHCVVRNNLVIVNGSLNSFYEIALFLCAISLVCRVKTSPLQKLGLTLSFAAGLFTIGATVMNTYWTESIIRNPGAPNGDFRISGMWTAAEAYIAITVASLLPIRAQLVACVDKIFAPCRRPKVWPEDSFAESGMTRGRDEDDEEKAIKNESMSIASHAVQVRVLDSEK